MKNIILTFCFVMCFNTTFCQTNIVDVSNGYTVMDAPRGTYIKDIFDTFTPFLGTWKYQNGNEILIIKLEKVTKYFDAEYGSYEDYIKGNYSYSTDGGATYVTNTIVANATETNPNINSFYTSSPMTPQMLYMSFKDNLYQKSGDATFTLLNSFPSPQLTMELEGRTRGYLPGETIPPPGFSIPNHVTLTKQ
ncbi:DUF6705 family protein [Flavobacterium sp. U410]